MTVEGWPSVLCTVPMQHGVPVPVGSCADFIARGLARRARRAPYPRAAPLEREDLVLERGPGTVPA